MQESPVAIRLRGLRKTFGDVVAVDGVDLDIADGEFLTLLGPSGSGKTTVLRMIAGFELPTAGTIQLDGVDVSPLPPFDRDVNTVFQDYALFPHMTVQQNVEYGLKVKKVGKAERRRRAERGPRRGPARRLRRPQARRQMSGGQRQRVALARALVNRPKVLLLDEPLGALDLKLREQMQVELKAIQREVGITFVFVTHDQEEALTMSDRIAVFNAGRIEQVGTPAEVYEQPATEFVAGFVGTSNLLRGEAARACSARTASFSVRPEKIRVAGADEPLAEGEHARPARCARSSTSARHPLRRRPRRRRPPGRPAAEPPTSSDVLGLRGCARAAGLEHGPRVPRRPDARRSRTHRRPAGGPARGDTTDRRTQVRTQRLLKIAAASSVAALLLAACGGSDGCSRRPAATPPGGVAVRRPVGDGEGTLNVLAWPGLRRGRLDRPGRRLGHAVRGGDRLPGQRQDLRHLRRGRQLMSGRRVRRRVGLRRRLAAPGLRRTRSSRSTPTSCPTTPTSSPA